MSVSARSSQVLGVPVTQSVRSDVGALPGFELSHVLLVVGDPGLQHTARTKHAAHSIRSPLATDLCAEGWRITVPHIHIFLDDRHKIAFVSNQVCWYAGSKRERTAPRCERYDTARQLSHFWQPACKRTEASWSGRGGALATPCEGDAIQARVAKHREVVRGGSGSGWELMCESPLRVPTPTKSAGKFRRKVKSVPGLLFEGLLVGRVQLCVLGTQRDSLLVGVFGRSLLLNSRRKSAPSNLQTGFVVWWYVIDVCVCVRAGVRVLISRWPPAPRSHLPPGRAAGPPGRAGRPRRLAPPDECAPR